MKTISTKYSKCTSVKILVEKTDEKQDIINDMKRRGFHQPQKPNFYSESMDIAEKYTQQGWVLTFVKYEPFEDK